MCPKSRLYCILTLDFWEKSVKMATGIPNFFAYVALTSSMEGGQNLSGIAHYQAVAVIFILILIAMMFKAARKVSSPTSSVNVISSLKSYLLIEVGAPVRK